MADGVSQMFIGALRRSREQGRQDARLRLARSDETVEVFRRNKVQLRMQLLTGAMQDRRRILRAAIVVRWQLRCRVGCSKHGQTSLKCSSMLRHRYPSAMCH